MEATAQIESLLLYVLQVYQRKKPTSISKVIGKFKRIFTKISGIEGKKRVNLTIMLRYCIVNFINLNKKKANCIITRLKNRDNREQNVAKIKLNWKNQDKN